LNNFSGFINWKFVEGNFKTEQVQIKLWLLTWVEHIYIN
jgi:hypothetical protein